MSKQILFTHNKAFAEGEQKRTINKEVQIGPVSLRILTIASLASLVLFYLAQTTQSATKSYEIQTLEREKQELTEDLGRLEIEAVRLQSLGTIKENLKDEIENNFEAAGKPESLE